MIKISRLDYFMAFRFPLCFGGLIFGALVGDNFPHPGIHIGAGCGFFLAMWLAWRGMPKNEEKKEI